MFKLPFLFMFVLEWSSSLPLFVLLLIFCSFRNHTFVACGTELYGQKIPFVCLVVVVVAFLLSLHANYSKLIQQPNKVRGTLVTLPCPTASASFCSTVCSFGSFFHFPLVLSHRFFCSSLFVSTRNPRSAGLPFPPSSSVRFPPFHSIPILVYLKPSWVVVRHGVIGTKKINRILNPGIVVGFRNRKFEFLMSAIKGPPSIYFRTFVISSVMKNNRLVVKPWKRAGSPLTNISPR